MKFDLEVFLAALGLAMVLEGLPYFISPSFIKTAARRLLDFNPLALRLMGLAIVAAGLAVVALARSLG